MTTHLTQDDPNSAAAATARAIEAHYATEATVRVSRHDARATLDAAHAALNAAREAWRSNIDAGARAFAECLHWLEHTRTIQERYASAAQKLALADGGELPGIPEHKFEEALAAALGGGNDLEHSDPATPDVTTTRVAIREIEQLLASARAALPRFTRDPSRLRASAENV